MVRKIILLLFVVFFMALVLFTGMMFITNETEVYSNEEITLFAEKPAFFTLSDPSVREEGADVIRKRGLSLFGIPLGSYTLTERTLDNGVSIIFEHVENTSWMPFVLSLQTEGIDDAAVKTWNPAPVSREADPGFGSDPTSNPYGTVPADEGEILQGNVYVSRGLTLGNGEEVNELRHEVSEFTAEEGRIEKSFWVSPKYQADTWLMMSPEPFFAAESEEDAWINHALENRQEQLNWLTPEGPLVKIPLTDDLRTELAYEVVEERTNDSVSAEWNESAPSVFFETMILNAEINQTR
ncbi:hypothetical protein ACTL32_02045 [Planococcus sp. FY231025]|uniref:hypothetical protein n=1 Tax=Planococcus sp. FY231025 TaxID=3455699 RepID=UPI003F93E973